MKATLLVPSKWMVSREFGTGSIPANPLVTIASVQLQQEEGETWGVLRFREPWAKPLKVNATHCRALVVMFGDETDRWVGKRISLYAKPGTFFGERGTAVRIAGSPELTAPKSFTVKKFGGGKDTYDLKPIDDGAPKAAPPHAAPGWWDKLQKLAAEKGISTDRLKVLTKNVMKRDKLLPSEITEADFAEVCMAISAELATPKETPPAEPGSGG